mmetsp:Transcript_32398/g.91808  ORF Transcript_32398/g.91808 Transcript_32398/m.91808 type:complete len:94 (+) Transcript_32398:1548-1829(+)
MRCEGKGASRPALAGCWMVIIEGSGPPPLPPAHQITQELKAAEVTDNCGRPQKRISLAKGPGDKKASGQVVVRKMASDGGRLFGRDSVQVKQQ